MTALDIILKKFLVFSVREARKRLSHFRIIAKNVSQEVSSMSGVEKSKVKLCILANTPSNFLILDEPTNHLDKDTKDALKEQLINYKGGIILFSHEEKRSK